jgi:hypothetical protein
VRSRGRREAEPAAPLESEDAADSRLRAALDVAAAHQARPDEVGSPLVAGEDSVATAHVLVEAQLAAGTQDPAEFGERRLHVGYRAQQPGDDDRVELPVGGGQVPGGAVDHPDRDGRGRGRLGRAVAQVRLRLDRHDLPHGRRVVREVQPVARADLDDPAGQPAEQFLPELTIAPLLPAGREPIEVPGEQWVLHEGFLHRSHSHRIRHA